MLRQPDNFRIERTAFHDSIISDMKIEGDHIHLEFNNILIDGENKNYYRATVDLNGVESVTCDGEIVNSFSFPKKAPPAFASVVDFTRSGQVATLVALWHFFDPNTDDTKVYKFTFNTFDVKGEKQPGYL